MLQYKPTGKICFEPFHVCFQSYHLLSFIARKYMIDTSNLFAEDDSGFSEEELSFRMDKVGCQRNSVCICKYPLRFQILDFEIELAHATSAQEDRKNESVLYNLMSVNELGDLPGATGVRYTCYRID